jgi:hypothetical protein
VRERCKPPAHHGVNTRRRQWQALSYGLDQAQAEAASARLITGGIVFCSVGLDANNEAALLRQPRVVHCCAKAADAKLNDGRWRSLTRARHEVGKESSLEGSRGHLVGGILQPIGVRVTKAGERGPDAQCCCGGAGCRREAGRKGVDMVEKWMRRYAIQTAFGSSPQKPVRLRRWTGEGRRRREIRRGPWRPGGWKHDPRKPGSRPAAQLDAQGRSLRSERCHFALDTPKIGLSLPADMRGRLRVSVC